MDRLLCKQTLVKLIAGTPAGPSTARVRMQHGKVQSRLITLHDHVRCGASKAWSIQSAPDTKAAGTTDVFPGQTTARSYAVYCNSELLNIPKATLLSPLPASST